MAGAGRARLGGPGKESEARRCPVIRRALGGGTADLARLLPARLGRRSRRAPAEQVTRSVSALSRSAWPRVAFAARFLIGGFPLPGQLVRFRSADVSRARVVCAAREADRRVSLVIIRSFYPLHFTAAPAAPAFVCVCARADRWGMLSAARSTPRKQRFLFFGPGETR